jgi:ubiquinone/menaquinone biosynthesis C-methylase UbiE
MSKQKEYVINHEANNWFNRNKHTLVHQEKIEKDFVLNNFKNLELNNIDKILAIGCSNGWRLNELQKITNASECYGIEPSSDAVKEGNELFPNIKLTEGTCENLPFEDNSFDLILVDFCMYLCDRNYLFKTISEIDRILNNNGHVMLYDYYPLYPYSNSYKHSTEICSYKIDLSKAFTWNPYYIMLHHTTSNLKCIQLDSLDHEKSDISEVNDRICLTVLKKQKEDAYLQK